MANNQYNDTGFNWKNVEIKTALGDTFNGSQLQSIRVPKAYSRQKKSPGQLLDMMQEVQHKGPISHKIVSEAEFERLAQRQVDRDGGKPMVEKTIFIVKPIYVPI